MAKKQQKLCSVDIVNQLGECIKAFREESGYTRAQISERSGISERYLIAIENEKSIPKVPVLNSLLRSLGMSANALFYPELSKENPELEHLIYLFMACDERERRIIIDLINSLLDSRTPHKEP